MSMSARRSRAALVIRLARLHFLVPGLMLYIFGHALAFSRGTPFGLDKFLFGYLMFGLAHLSVSFSNDYFDAESDRNSQRSVLSGGSGVLVAHPELRPLAYRLALGLLVASVVTAAAFVLVYGYTLIFFGFAAVGALLGWFYSAPPAKLSYRGLGEVSTAFGAGFIMPGMGYFVATGTLDAWFLVLTAPLVCYGFFFILTVEMPDVESDRVAGKVNVMVGMGRRTGLSLMLAVVLLGTTSLAMIYHYDALGDMSVAALLVALSLIPFAGALAGLRVDVGDRNSVIRQAKINFATLMVFLFLAIVGVALIGVR